MNNELLLITGEDIPFIEAQTTIHQPTMKEISLIGEESFLIGSKFLNFSKDILSEQDKKGLENRSDFEIFMSIMQAKDRKDIYNNVLMVLALLFPNCEIKITHNEILLLQKEQGMTRINNENYDIFKDIINSMFDLGNSDLANGEYNPADARASKIAEKLKKHKEKIAALKGQIDKIAIFSRYISILTVGLEKNMNDFNNYTVFQLIDEFKRYQKKQSFDMYVQAKMAGAKDLEEVDNWMDDIHS